MSIPIGYTLRFPPGSNVPEDYLELNGQVVSVDEYPELCRSLIWGVGDLRHRIDATHFRLPNCDMQAVWPGSRFAMRAKNPNIIEEPWFELVPTSPAF